MEEMLAALRAPLNRLDHHFCNSTTLYERFVDETGARLLIRKLQRLERLCGTDQGR